ncbi:MAG: 4-hydroxy-tetrahydrodipicolinate reductase [Peptococcaceae bacterium]
MGREVLRTVWQAEDMLLTGAVDVRGEGQDAGSLFGSGKIGILLVSELEQVLQETRPDVMVDFTTPAAVLTNIKTALKNKVCPVVGTTGISKKDIPEINELAKREKLGCIIAPNFALGALLMMHLAAQAAKYFPQVEIIEMHHHQKLDAPSGTALKTAEIIQEHKSNFKPELNQEIENLPGSRGGLFDGSTRIHSVRLPGLVAHQEVIFGGPGQVLTIRHDSFSRESFMPGVLMAIRQVIHLEGVLYGLENVLFKQP